MREVNRHLFIPRRPLIASMLASDPDNSWLRIAKASVIMAARPGRRSQFPQLAPNARAGTARFRQLSGAFRKTYARRKPFSG